MFVFYVYGVYSSACSLSVLLMVRVYVCVCVSLWFPLFMRVVVLFVCLCITLFFPRVLLCIDFCVYGLCMFALLFWCRDDCLYALCVVLCVYFVFVCVIRFLKCTTKVHKRIQTINEYKNKRDRINSNNI